MLNLYSTDFLKEKTCILITHQIQYLTNVNQIILINDVNMIKFSELFS